MNSFTIERVLALPEVLAPSTMYIVKSIDSGLVEIYFTSADALEVRHVINKSEVQSLINDAVSGFSGTLIVNTIAERDALVLSANTMVLVLDATGDGSVAAGAATYLFNMAATIWHKIAEFESLDLVLTWSMVQDGPVSSPGQIDTAVGQSHTHSNLGFLDKVAEDGNGDFVYNGALIGANVSTLQQQITSKADLLHTHPVGEIVNLQAALDSKALLTHAHTISDISDIANYTGNLINIDGPTSTYINRSTTYVITNHDSYVTYILGTTNGTVSRINDIITYTPATVGAGGFTINGKALAITVNDNLILQPSISAPVNNAVNLGPSLDLVSSAFDVTTPGSDTHLDTDWQIATDVLFNNVLWSSLANAVNKTAITASLDNSSVNTVLYLRVRYRGTTYLSDWSNTVTITTKATYLPTVETAILSASDKAASDQFSYAVAISEDNSRIVIGSPYVNISTYTDVGKAYIFSWSGTSWVQEAILTPAGGLYNWQFGYSIDIDATGTRLAIGARKAAKQYTTPYSYYTGGIVYIYKRTGTSWAEETFFYSDPNYISGADFGTSVAIDNGGDRVVVGAPYTNYSGPERGTVYVFKRTETTWTRELFNTNAPTSYEHSGTSVDISNDGSRIIVGTPQSDPTAITDAGRVDIWVRNGVTWTVEATLTASDKVTLDAFGTAVAISGDGSRAIVGAPMANPSSLADGGKVYIYRRSGSAWSQETILTTSDVVANDRFGQSVSIDKYGIRVAVGSYLSDPGTISAAGSAYLFSRSETTWTQQTKLAASDKTTNHWFGFSVALAPVTPLLVVGAPQANPSGVTIAGKAYLFS